MGCPVSKPTECHECTRRHPLTSAATVEQISNELRRLLLDECVPRVATETAALLKPNASLNAPLGDSATARRLSLSGDRRAHWQLRGKYALFISHYKLEAATEARMCQIELEKILAQPVFIDSDHLRDLRMLKGHVASSDCLLLLLTSHFLHRPWCLIEIYTAIECGIPIIALNVRGAYPYDYNDATEFLEQLDTRLEQVNPGAAALLRDNGIDLLDAAHKLTSVLPSIIASELAVSASRNVLAAQLLDLVDAMHAAEPIALPVSTTAQWAEQRARKHERPVLTRRRLKTVPESPGTTPESSCAPSVSCGPSLASAPGLPATPFSLAVGYNSLSDSAEAARRAYRHLVTKLSNQSPHVVMLFLSAQHDVKACCTALRRLLPSTTPFLGGTCPFGILVDGKWISGGADGRFLALLGLHDPAGCYSTFECAIPSPSSGAQGDTASDAGFDEDGFAPSVRAAVADALERGSMDARVPPYAAPELMFLFTAASNMVVYECAKRAAQSAIPASTRVCGGGLRTMVVGNLFVVHSAQEGRLQVHVQGCVGVVCWPSVAAATTLAHGLLPSSEPGTVTAVADQGRTLVSIDGQSAWSKFLKWASVDESFFELLKEYGETTSLQSGIVQDRGARQAEWVMARLRTIHEKGGLFHSLSQGVGDTWSIVHVDSWEPEAGILRLANTIMEPGTQVRMMSGNPFDVIEQTAVTARMAMQAGRFDVERTSAAFFFICSLYYVMNGDEGMQALAESMSDTLGWVPMLGILGGPEYGNPASTAAQQDLASACSTYSVSVAILSNSKKTTGRL